MTKSLCVSCGAVFASVSAFDRHRIGDYAPRQSRQTPNAKPEARQRHRAPTRRCLTAQEMQARGMAQNARGWWTTDARTFPRAVFEPLTSATRATAGAA